MSFIIAPTQSNPSGVSVGPSSLTFVSDSGVTAQTLAISAATGVAGQVHFSAAANSTGWLAVTGSSSSVTPAAVTIQVFPAGLKEGVYDGAVTITVVETGKSTVVPVTLKVPADALSNVKLTPYQRALTFNYQLNAASNPSQSVYVFIDSGQFSTFTATVSDSWLAVASASWITPAASADCVAPGFLFVTVNPVGLNVGTYQGSITLTATGLPPVQIPVTLNISAAPVLNANPSFVSFDTASDALSANLEITGSASLAFTAAVSAGATWLKVSPTSGVADVTPANLTVTADATGLQAGTYNGSIRLTGPNGSPSLTIPVQLKAAGATVSNELTITPKDLQFAAIAGDPDPSQYLTIFTTTSTEQKFTAAAISDVPFFSVEPPSGSTPAWLKVTARTGLTPGLYTGSILITSLLTGTQESISVTHKVTARLLSVTPSLLAFTQTAPGATVAAQELQVTANAPSAFRIGGKPGWVRVQPDSGLTTPAKLTVSVNPSGMAPGKYDGSILLSGPNELSIPVSLTIPEQPPPTVTPTSVTLSYELGSAAPAPQTIRVANPDSAVQFTASASTESGIGWLAIAPVSGTTPGTLTLSINVAQLTPGSHAGSVTVTIATSPPRVLKVPVTLTVTGSALRVLQVLNSATQAPSQLAPGELVTIAGSGLGPVAPLAARPSAAGAYDTELGGVRVTFDDIPAPLLLVHGERIEAIVPYGIYGRASTRRYNTSYSIPIELKVADAAPGVFTAGTLA